MDYVPFDIIDDFDDDIYDVNLAVNVGWEASIIVDYVPFDDFGDICDDLWRRRPINMRR